MFSFELHKPSCWAGAMWATHSCTVVSGHHDLLKLQKNQITSDVYSKGKFQEVWSLFLNVCQTSLKPWLLSAAWPHYTPVFGVAGRYDSFYSYLRQMMSFNAMMKSRSWELHCSCEALTSELYKNLKLLGLLAASFTAFASSTEPRPPSAQWWQGTASDAPHSLAIWQTTSTSAWVSVLKNDNQKSDQYYLDTT